MKILPVFACFLCKKPPVFHLLFWEEAPYEEFCTLTNPALPSLKNGLSSHCFPVRTENKIWPILGFLMLCVGTQVPGVTSWVSETWVWNQGTMRYRTALRSPPSIYHHTATKLRRKRLGFPSTCAIAIQTNSRIYSSVFPPPLSWHAFSPEPKHKYLLSLLYTVYCISPMYSISLLAAPIRGG